MTRLLLVTKRIQHCPSGGRELLCKLNYDCLAEIYGPEFHALQLDAEPAGGFRALLAVFRGYIDGIDQQSVADAIKLVVTGGLTTVFIDGSNLGEAAAALKRACPSVRIVTFFHNVESRFFLGSLKERKSPKALAVLLANYLAERKAVRWSDALIAMSRRDSALLGQLYGRTATHISPMALENKLPKERPEARAASKGKYMLFVGGSFYANRAGIVWFVENVVPKIAMRLVIVGRGLEALKPDLDRSGKVEVVGAVDDLAEWYRDAHFVVAPIFDGSGMKTKVAEALMFGKKIAGSPEAFSGYEDVADQVGWTCRAAREFVAIINQQEGRAIPTFDPEMRLLFEQRFSYEAALARFVDILGPTQGPRA